MTTVTIWNTSVKRGDVLTTATRRWVVKKRLTVYSVCIRPWRWYDTLRVLFRDGGEGEDHARVRYGGRS